MVVRRGGGAKRTLPPSVRYDGHARVDQPVQRDETGLDGPAHGAHDDELHFEVGREVGFEVLAQLGGLLAAEVGEVRVVEAVEGFCRLVNNRVGMWNMFDLLSMLWIAWAWRIRMSVGGMVANVGS